MIGLGIPEDYLREKLFGRGGRRRSGTGIERSLGT